MDSDPSKLNSWVDNAPFQKGNSVDIGEVKSLMGSLSSSEIAVTLSFLPPEIVAYVVCREGVSCIRSKLSETEKKRLAKDIRGIPHRLENGVGERSMNKHLHEFADLLKEKIGNRHIRALSPYANLHRVPWRALLHYAGVPWEQLSFVTTFNVLIADSKWRVSIDSHGTALGHDDDNSWGTDLDQEARSFAQVLPLDYEDATSSNIRSALQNSGTVLISCHGRENDGELLLSLRDGEHPTSTWCPHEVGAKLVVLSACESGVFSMAHGDHPVGAAPKIVARGADICLGTRWKVNAKFAANFITHIGVSLAEKRTIGEAFALALKQCDKEGYDLWQDLACYEIFSAP
jgi:hypothetical protein